MNQEKIGKFIAKLRKEKNLTQKELAEKLNVTDRAIGNWENGRRMPDVSFFKSLCEILDISVNELVNGEKMSKDKIISTSDKTIINTLNTNENNKKKSSYIIKLLSSIMLILIIIILILFFCYRDAYPKIDIYNLSVSPSDPDKEYYLKKQFSFEQKNKIHNIYYYGIDSSQLCDSKDDCYEIKTALNHEQVNVDTIRKYLDSQYVLNNINKQVLYDGGTTIYSNERFSIIFCNTNENNKDIYIGTSDMVDKLDGAYCGHDKNPTKKFIRTYRIMSATVDKDDEFLNVTLKQNDGQIGTVKINNSHNIVVGRTYEFSFFTFDEFEDTIENIFENSTFLETKETDKIETIQINEPIYINTYIDNGAELNEVKNVTMTIKEGTLTKTSATIIITDLSNQKYTYGGYFRIDRKENETWKEVKLTRENFVFNDMAYGVDKNGKLEMEQNWSVMYGKLNSGKYRLVKYILPNVERAVTQEDRKYFSVEFSID